MSFLAAPVAYGSTGVKTIDVGFAPAGIRITVGQKLGTTQNFEHFSYGVLGFYEEEPVQNYHATYQDTTGGKTVSGNNKLVSHWERVSGVLTEVLAVEFDSFVGTDVKLNVTIANANYNMILEVWD